MKKNIISGIAALISGLLIALGPQFLFKVCGGHDDVFPRCHWSAQAEIGTGIIIAALGICLLLFSDRETHFGLTVAVFLTSIVALFIPHWLIGGCDEMATACRRLAFPALTVVCSLTLIGSVIYIIYLGRKIKF